ncbi:MAG: MFS transporter [Lautropia sp.]
MTPGLPPGLRARLLPVIVASPILLQNVDTTVMATALPTIARALDVEPLRLNLAITAYLISLAVFLPLAGWCAERFGARRVFCAAIGFFALGSGLCGMATTLPQLVAFRVIQGLGGALMVPVGRLLLMRNIDASQMIGAMVWFTIPPVIGRLLGPLFGGAIVTWTSWRWIFLINVPLALAAIALALLFVDESREPGPPPPFDAGGFVLLAIGMTGLQVALDTAGHRIAPAWFSWTVAAAGAAALYAYLRRSRDQAQPLIDPAILRIRTYRASQFGGMPLRIAIGASPFLLSLMFQLGFGLTPLTSGALTVASALGALATRTMMTRFIHRFGFRRLLIGAAIMTGLMYSCYGLFRPETPHWVIFGTLLIGGLVNSMVMVSLQVLGYTEMPQDRMSHATTLATMLQQLSFGFGVVLGAGLVSAVALWRDGDPSHLTAFDFMPAFVVIGIGTLLSLAWFFRLHPEDGETLRSRR